MSLLVPLLLPKFVPEPAAVYYELRKRGTSVAGFPIATYNCRKVRGKLA